MSAVIVVPLVFMLIAIARKALGNASYERIVVTFFGVAFSLIGLIFIYGALRGRL